jgi:uncharacterized protein YecT (DUF1311 family)
LTYVKAIAAWRENLSRTKQRRAVAIRAVGARESKMRIAAAVIILLAMTAPAAAAQTASHRLCNPDRIKQTNAWVDCLQKALDDAEARLNAVNGRIAAAMQAGEMLEEPSRGENRALFLAAQKNWLALRDDDCKAYGAHRAGLGFGAAQFRLMCLLDATVSRVDTLKARYADDLK